MFDIVAVTEVTLALTERVLQMLKDAGLGCFSEVAAAPTSFV